MLLRGHAYVTLELPSSKTSTQRLKDKELLFLAYNGVNWTCGFTFYEAYVNMFILSI